MAAILPPWSVTWTGAAFAAMLIWVSVRDVILFEVPDVAAALLVVLGLAVAGNLVQSLLGVLLWAAVFWLVSWGARKLLRRDALGLGDVKLMAGLGAWLGPVAPIYVTLFAAISGIVTLFAFAVLRGDKIEELSGTGIAFGPFLCLFAWVSWEIGVRV